MTKTLRAGLVGLGMMGRNHARVLGSLEGVELVAVADQAGDPYGAAQGYKVGSDVDFVIREGVDYAIVAVPTALHADIAVALAEAGVHALIEKPVASDLDDARRIADAFRSRSLIGGVGHIERYNPALLDLRRRIEAGEVGEIYQVATRRQGPFPARVADVGVIKDLATHDIDTTAWITSQRYSWVAARTAAKSGRPHEDMVSITGQLTGGTIVSHLVNWLSPLKERTTVVSCLHGMYVADTLTADLTFYANGVTPQPWGPIADFRGVSEGDVVRFAIAKPEPLRTEHEQFRDAVLGLPATYVSLADGAEIVRVAEAVSTAARTGRCIALAPDSYETVE